MAFDLPPSPVNGQTFTDPTSGAQYVYQSPVWMQASAAQIKLTANPQNMLVNGAFQVSQENGTTGVSAISSYPADQWRLNFNGAGFSAGAVSAYMPLWGRNTVATYNNATYASPITTDYLMLMQILEGNRTLPLRWDAPAHSIPAVLNFKFQADKSGTYGVSLRNGAADRSIGFNLPYLTTDGIKEFTFPIPAPGAGTWNADASVGTTLIFAHTLGVGYKAAAHGVWQTALCLGGPAMTNNAAAGANAMRVMDAQLLADPLGTGIAPPFVARSYFDDLVECQRYWQNEPGTGTAIVSGIAAGAGQFAYAYIPLRVTMRASPTMAAPTIAYSNSSGLSVSAPSVGGFRTAIASVAAGAFYAIHNWTANARMV